MANWSELQYDVLVHVAKRLNLIEDYLNFAAVCKPWRRAATKNNFNSDLPRVPWLMLAEEENNKEEGGEANTCRKFFSLYNGMILKKRIPNARGKRCMESMGWLIAAGKDEGEITLLHPFSGVQIQLPHPNTTKGYNCQLTVDPWTFFHKAVLSASPSKTSDYVLMVIEANNKYLSFWRPGDLRWTRIMKEDNPALHRDVVYFNGKFYAVQWLGHVLVCDVTGAEPMAQKVARLPLDQIGDELYIVESLGSLFVVARHGGLCKSRIPMTPIPNDYEVYDEEVLGSDEQLTFETRYFQSLQIGYCCWKIDGNQRIRGQSYLFRC
ncbi:hypothetical protein A4A49_20901 [Nicotiana attenuata]|uniref:Uncharacterized protein n=1 Tax=Nicotiana attenuata TaxID=49451 RepID=A0A1J6IIG5_NICAT|nr:hypothetical protein A4A49_20901 [Nicotiana attenuata]